MLQVGLNYITMSCVTCKLLAIKGVIRDCIIRFFIIYKKYLAKMLANRILRVVYSQT